MGSHSDSGRRSFLKLGAAAVALPLASNVFESPAAAQAQGKPGAGFAVAPGLKGGQDVTGPYEPVEGWPHPLSSLPGHDQWTWGAVQGIFAENPNRIFIAQRGELPIVSRPKNTAVPQFGPSLSFPINGLPYRNASQGPVSALPIDVEYGPWQGTMGVDTRWEHCILVVDATGKIVEEWTQWDSLFRRPHAIYINPYDADKNVWVVDDNRHSVFKFTNDGKKLLQSLGTRDVPGSDDKTFNRPTFLAWLPDSTMFVADGYTNTRVVKFDRNGKYLTSWGKKGNPPNDTRPGYMNSVHGIAVDPATRRVFVNDRGNRRIQVFDENGTFLDQWSLGPVSAVSSLYMSADRHLWASDAATGKLLKYDLDGHFLYAWGSTGEFPGAMWGLHQFSVDQEGNLYFAEATGGRAQKLRPRKGANSAFLVGQPVRSAWK